jgi:hypothetical protein
VQSTNQRNFGPEGTLFGSVFLRQSPHERGLHCRRWRLWIKLCRLRAAWRGINCFDGSRGAGHIFGNGSVIGTIQVRGSGPVHSVWLTAGTLKVKGEAICASLNGIPIEPCFNLNRTDDQSFRGSVSGLDFAYCDFSRRGNVTGMRPRPQPLSRRRRW